MYINNLLDRFVNILRFQDDFRNLYTATEKLKIEYRNLQEDYRKNKIETNRLSLKLTELQGELSSRDERCSNLELQFNKLNKCCEVRLNFLYLRIIQYLHFY